MGSYRAIRMNKHISLLLDSGLTIREIAKTSGWSASTVQRDIAKAMEIYPDAIDDIKSQLKTNKLVGSKKAAKILNNKRWGVK